MSYCKFCLTDKAIEVEKKYHDYHYGFPVYNDNLLFKRLVMEINQAGLSWKTILIKENNFDLAFDAFEISKIACYDTHKIDKLLLDSGIIRNKLKINAVIYNANKILEIQQEHGSFYNWLEINSILCKNTDEWLQLFKKTFKFVGYEIVNEFLMSIGFIKGAHEPSCSIYDLVINKKPLWLNYEK